MKIIFFCNWGDNSENLLQRYKKLTPTNLGIYKNLVGVKNLNEADCIIFLEGIPKNFNLNYLLKKKVICFPREPNIKTKNWEKLKLKYGFTYDNFYHVVTNPQFINKDYDFLKNLEYQDSEKILSAIISNKNNGNGYKLRYNLLINLASKYPEICDIYGYGWKNELGSAYKGELGFYHNKNKEDEKTKFDALINYKYSICIENCNKKNYFSEKFTDAILCWTIPIYYGCPNISDFFPVNSYYYIDIEEENVIQKIKNIIKKPITQDNINALKKARNLILSKYNIWSTINNLSI